MLSGSARKAMSTCSDADRHPLEQRRDVRPLLGVHPEEVEERDDGDDERAGEHAEPSGAGPEPATDTDRTESGRPGQPDRWSTEPGRAARARDQPDDSSSIDGDMSAPQLGEVVGGGAGAAAEDGDDDAEADDRLGGGDDEDEEHRRLAVDARRRVRDRATKLRVTALSISSMHISSTSGLRRTSTPTAPMPNSTAPSTRYHVGRRHAERSTRRHVRRRAPSPSAHAAGGSSRRCRRRRRRATRR